MKADGEEFRHDKHLMSSHRPPRLLWLKVSKTQPTSPWKKKSQLEVVKEHEDQIFIKKEEEERKVKSKSQIVPRLDHLDPLAHHTAHVMLRNEFATRS